MAFALGTTAGAGTISIVAGGTVVTGVATNFVAANVGAILVVGAQWGVIATRTSTTSITLDRPFTTAVTGSAYTISANIPIITQTGTDTSLASLTGVAGVTTSLNLWTITSATLVINGSLTINRLTNRLRFLNTASVVSASTTIAAMTIGATGTFNNSVVQSLNGYSYKSGNYAILFDVTIPAIASHSTGTLIGTILGSTTVLEGDIEFTATLASVLLFGFLGTTTLQFGALLNSNAIGTNYLFYVPFSTGNLTLNNYTTVGITLRVADNALTINNYAAIAGPNPININTASPINNPQYVGLQDLGNGFIRTAAASLKYFQLVNFSSSALTPNASLASTTGSQVLFVNQLILSATGSAGAIQGVKFWAKHSNNGFRSPTNYGAGQAYEIATTEDLTYTAITAVSGIAPTLNIISLIYWQDTASTFVRDYRGNNGAQDLNIYSCAYNYVLSNSLSNLYPLNNGIYGGANARNQGFVLLTDTSITEPIMATVAAYTTLNTAQQVYDYLKYFIYTNFAGETATYVSRSGNTINAGAYNVVIDATASVPFAIAGNTLTIKSSVFTGSITTTGTVTLANGAILSGSTITANVLQALPASMTSVTINGNLTHNTNTAITVTDTNNTITGTVSNSGSATVTRNLINSTFGTVGTRIVTRLVTSLNINGLTAGSQIYIADGSGSQVAYVASSGTSYTLNTTGQTGTWTWKVARYGFTAQTGSHSPATASTTISVTLLTDLFITQATKATVAAYEFLPNMDTLYDYSAYYETLEIGIPYARIITKAGTNASAGAYNVTLNDTGDLFIFDGSSLNIWAGNSLAPGTTITGALFTSGTVTIPTNLIDTAITANVIQPIPSDLSGVNITGNLTYANSDPFAFYVTLTNCVVTGTVSNSGTADIIITKVNTTLGAIGARVTAQQFAAISAPNLIAGTRVRVFNNTNSVELFNGVLASAGFSQSFLFTGNKTVTLTATYTNGATAKLSLSASGNFTASGLSFLNSQSDDTVYNEYGINGSAVTGFNADYAQDDVNLTMATNFTAANLYAWWIYNLTTEVGIREFFGGITALDSANIRINNSVISIFLDNTTAFFIYQTDPIRLFRSDNVYPAKTITTGGGGIQVNWNANVYVGTADIDAKLNIVNEGVQKVSLFKPHRTDL
jgi:hypothetical protein